MLLNKLHRVRTAGDITRFSCSVYCIWSSQSPVGQLGLGKALSPSLPFSRNILLLSFIFYLCHTYCRRSLHCLRNFDPAHPVPNFHLILKHCRQQPHTFICVIRFHIEQIKFHELSSKKTLN